MKKILLSLALLCAVVHGAWADYVSYIYYTVSSNGETITKHTDGLTLNSPLTADVIRNNPEDRLYSGTYVLNESFTYDERIVIFGDVKLVLKDGCTLTAEQGIRINTNASLTIYAQSEVEGTMGKLVAIETHHDKAAIGGNKNYKAGRLIIHGGEIEADASEGKYAAGIGGGYGDGSGMEGITIYGGKVTAKGARYGAGIGGGKNNNNPGTIKIYGGTVEATGGYMGAGIGGGENRAGWTTNIYGGDITATGHACAAGIGGGDAGAGGVINIKGGTVNATGSETGIGSGSRGWSGVNGSTTQITISGNAKVTATGGTGYATGIGSVDVDGHTCTITIEGDAEVIATGNGHAAGIGASNGDAIGTVIIRGNAKVTATGGNSGAGIGTGDDDQKGSLTISGNAVVTATGKSGGAGIGGLLYHPGFPVTIESGATVKAYGSRYYNYDKKTYFTSAAIGGGAEKADGSTVTIENGARVSLFTKEGDFGYGYAIGKSYKDKKTGTLTLGDQLQVKRMKTDGSDTKFISTDNRIAACQFEECERLEILPCEHSVWDYQIVGGDDGQHYKQCKYCAYKFGTENHSYNTNGYCSYCNYKATEVIKVNLYSGDNSGYTAQTIRMPKGHSYILPSQYGLPEYMVFEGWLKDPATAPTTWEKTASETLLDPGTEITPDADVNLYARYSYRYGTEWTWTATSKTASATLKIINLENNSVVETITGSDVAISAKSITPTASEPGSVMYSAEVSYTDAKGRSFNFTDEHTVPYYIGVSLGEVDNTTTLTENDKGIVTASLTGRTLYKDGKWNTLCLPFDVEIAGSPLAGATVKQLRDASFENGTLTLTFEDATGIKAGKPYLIKWNSGDNLGPSDLIFTGVTLTKDLYEDEISTDDNGTTTVTFMGTYKKLSYYADDRSILLLGANNTLYYPQSGASLGAQRGFFKLSGITAGDLPQQARTFVLDLGDEDNVTGIIEAEANSSLFTLHSSLKEAWYTLDGRKLSTQPVQKGIYIYNGKKVIIK
jgi:hypothetical protein